MPYASKISTVVQKDADGAVHPFIVRRGLKVLLAVETNLKCCFLAKFRQ